MFLLKDIFCCIAVFAAFGRLFLYFLHTFRDRSFQERWQNTYTSFLAIILVLFIYYIELVECFKLTFISSSNGSRRGSNAYVKKWYVDGYVAYGLSRAIIDPKLI